MKYLAQWLLFSACCYYLAACGAERRVSRSDTAPPRVERPATSQQRDVVDYARLYLGTPYRYAGKAPGGFDCSGYTCYVLKNFDVQLPGNSGAQEVSGRRIKAAEARAGDLVFFRRSKGGKVFHVALVTANDADGLRVIHSTSSRGVVEDNITTNSYWGPKVKTFRRVL